MTSPKTYTLLGADGKPYQSAAKGQLGGHRRTRIYGRLDCPAALRAIARGGYTRHRVFFADEPTAIAAGYRPCATCSPARHRQWKAAQPGDMPAVADGLGNPVRLIRGEPETAKLLAGHVEAT